MSTVDLLALETYPNIEAFYAAFPPARDSVESDYGCWWKDDDGGNWRVTYVHDTGHVYAVAAGCTIATHLRIGGEVVAIVSAGDNEGPVVILGQLRAFTQGREARLKRERLERWKASGYRRELAADIHSSEPPEAGAALQGWAERCGEQGSLAWALQRVRGFAV